MENVKCTAVIILNYNNVEDTIACIDSIEKCNSARIKYIVVDNGSSRDGCVDSLIRYVRKMFAGNNCIITPDKDIERSLPLFTLVLNTTNDGYAGGNNIGLNIAKQDDEIDHVLILNNDILFVEDIIPKLAEYCSSLNNCASVSPLLFNKNGEIDYCCARTEASYPEIFFRKLFMSCIANHFLNKRYYLKNLDTFPETLAVDLTSGSCMFMNKEVLSTIGGFDPSTFLYYEEDILNVKFKQNNLKNYLCTNLKCIHLGGKSTSSLPSMFSIKCEHESCLYYFKNYTSLSQFRYVMLEIVMNYYYWFIKFIKIFKK